MGNQPAATEITEKKQPFPLGVLGALGG